MLSPLRARVQRALFSLGIVSVGHSLVLRDRLLGRIQPASGSAPSTCVQISSGQRLLPGVLVEPPTGVARQATVLICHGIGELVEHWACAQELLAARGIASLVFHDAGRGQSGGWLSGRL